jgi:hypothetical protein
MAGYREAAVRNCTIHHSSSKQSNDESAYHQVRKHIASTMLGYYLIARKLHPADTTGKQWRHQKI